MMATIQFFISSAILTTIQTARILTVAPFPSYSHQIIYRPIHEELVRRGHQVTFITTNPAYPGGGGPENLTEVDVGPESYRMWAQEFNLNVFGRKNFVNKALDKIITVTPKIFEMQLKTKKVKEVIEKQYDLLILQGWFRAPMVLSHLHRVPIVKMSSITVGFNEPIVVGTANHPLYYPMFHTQRMYNLSWWEEIFEVYYHWSLENKFDNNEVEENAMLRRHYPDMPELAELDRNVDLLLLNMHPLWDRNRPLPPNTLYFGFVHQKPEKPLPEDIQNYMDSSKHGVIYMSFGTNIPPSKLPQHIKNIFMKVFSELPYDVLWKFDEQLPNCPPNVKTSKWFPQSDIFKHPNLKLIITQGGLQTAEEAISAARPVVCVPFLGDQWLNCETYAHHGMGRMLEVETLTEEQFKHAVVDVITDKGYRDSAERLRRLCLDERERPLKRAVRVLERALVRGGRHLRAPAAGLRARDYLELDLLVVVVALALVAAAALALTLYWLARKILRMFSIKVNVKKL